MLGDKPPRNTTAPRSATHRAPWHVEAWKNAKCCLAGFLLSFKGPPTPLPAQSCMNRPYFSGTLGGHCASLGLSKVSTTDQEGHPSRQHGPICLQSGRRWSKRAQDGPMTAQDGLKRAEKATHEVSESSRKSFRKAPSNKNQWFPLGFPMVSGSSCFWASISSTRPRRSPG